MLNALITRVEAIAAAIAHGAPSEPALPSAWDPALREVQDWAQSACEDELDGLAQRCRERLAAVAAAEPAARAARLVALGDALAQLLAPLRAMAGPPPTPSAHPAGVSPPAPGAELEIDLEIVREFVIEAGEQLADADGRLLTIERAPADVDAINAVFRALHTIKGVAGFLQLGVIEELAHAAEDMLDQARTGRRQLAGAALELIFEAVDALKRQIAAVDAAVSDERAPVVGGAADQALIGRIRAAVASVASGDDEVLDEPGDEPGPALPADETEPVALAPASAGADRAADTIRIDAARLDRLVEAIGELVIIESMATRAARQDGRTNVELARHLTRMTKITREVQELAGTLRMVPVRATFQRMARLARDVARRSGKQVDFRTVGSETELDKSVVDRLVDPLVHMVRNAIDHGLEREPDDRRRAGKPEIGRVELRAFHRGGNIVIEIEDDGRGLDEAKILAKAIQRGLVREGETLSTRDVLGLICVPGFSTADQVSNISGRGVGMDVVKRQIDAMGGALEITSVPGRGTCFSMRLPLTLAVIDGLVIRLGGERYILPTLSVVRLITPRHADLTPVPDGNEALMVQGRLVSVLRLDELFGRDRRDAAPSLAVVAEAHGTTIAIYIDELIGQMQAVIKNLGGGLGDVPGVSGCAILPDGRVGLVLDVDGLIRLAARRGEQRTAGRSALTSGASPWSE